MNKVTKIDVENTIKELQNHLNELPDAERPNLWKIIEYGRDSYEIRYSKFLRWLLDPNETHGSGDIFAREFWKVLKSQNVTWSSSSEAKAEENNIDVHIYDDFNDRCLAIELKVYTDAHNNQLKRYADILDTEYKNADKLYVFLKPDGSKPAVSSEWDNRWVCFSYEQLREILDKVIVTIDKSEYKYKKDAKKLIADFRDDVIVVFNEVTCPQLAKALCSELNEDEVQKAVSDFVRKDADRKILIDYIEKNGRQGQVKTPSIMGQELIRKIFNDLAGKQIDISDSSNFGNEGKDERMCNKPLSVLKGLANVRLTRGKGQGLNLDFDGGEWVYLSVGNVTIRGETEVLFPNDGVQLRRAKGAEMEFIIERKERKDVQLVLENYETERNNLFEAINNHLAGECENISVN